MTSIDHIGIAVKKPDAVSELYRRLLGVHNYKDEKVASEGIRTHFLHAGSTKLELLESITEGTAVDKFLKRKGEGIHHIAFEVSDIERTFNRARNLGYTVLSDAPYEGADGKLVFFIHPKETHGVLIECCQQSSYFFEEISIPFEEEQLHGFLAGEPSAPKILVLHGSAGCTMMDTAPIMQRLAERYRVLGLDFSQHGASDPTDRDFSNELFLGNIDAALAHAEWNSAHVLGFSMGGAVALLYAHTHPDRVKKIAVHGTHLTWSHDDVSRVHQRLSVQAIPEQERTEWSNHHEDLELLFKKTRDYVAGLPSFADTWQSMLGDLNQQVLVSTHDEDPLFSLDATLQFTEHLRDSRLCVIPGTSHALPRSPLDDILFRFFPRT